MPRSILEVRPNLPLAVDFVLKRALSKDPHDRYATVQAFADDLYVASQDITQEVGTLPVPTSQRSRKVVARPTLVGTPPHGEEEHKEQRPIFVGELDGPTLQTAITVPDAQRELPVTPAPDAPRSGHSSEVSTEMMRVYQNKDGWVWSALVLNLLICLVVAAEYAWQVGNATVVADMLLVVWPGLLTGPLLAVLFRRVSYSTPLWGLFWGVFFGLTDGLVSIVLSLLWAALASLPRQYQCPNWCVSGDGVGIMINTVGQFATQALVPAVLTLWIAVIGGAIIGVMRVRSS
jgi:hypothetical protein